MVKWLLFVFVVKPSRFVFLIRCTARACVLPTSQVVYRAVPEYTFQDLLRDACHYWSINPRDACLKDAFNRVCLTLK